MQLRDFTAPFPLSLRASSTPIPSSEVLTAIDIRNTNRHNLALNQFGRHQFISPSEEQILLLASFLATWGENPDVNSGYGVEHISWPTVCVFNNLLNYDLGRLDGGVLSEWVCAWCTNHGIDMDTGALL